MSSDAFFRRKFKINSLLSAALWVLTTNPDISKKKQEGRHKHRKLGAALCFIPKNRSGSGEVVSAGTFCWLII
jgi:hypothetical protein